MGTLRELQAPDAAPREATGAREGVHGTNPVCSIRVVHNRPLARWALPLHRVTARRNGRFRRTEPVTLDVELQIASRRGRRALNTTSLRGLADELHHHRGLLACLTARQHGLPEHRGARRPVATQQPTSHATHHPSGCATTAPHKPFSRTVDPVRACTRAAGAPTRRAEPSARWGSARICHATQPLRCPSRCFPHEPDSGFASRRHCRGRARGGRRRRGGVARPRDALLGSRVVHRARPPADRRGRRGCRADDVAAARRARGQARGPGSRGRVAGHHRAPRVPAHAVEGRPPDPLRR